MTLQTYNNNPMRRLSKSKKESPNQVSPWLEPNNSNRSDFDEIHFRSISLLNPTSQTSTPHHKSQACHEKRFLTYSKSSIDKEKKLTLCGKTLSVIKDYYRKNYTQETQLFIEGNKALNEKKIKQNNLKKLANLHKEVSFKRTSIIDLTKSLNDNIQPNKIKIVIQKDNNKDQVYNRILKIKQQMIRNKQRRKLDKKQIEINDEELRPESKSVPLRVKSSKKSSTKMFLPDKNFGSILSDFLQKV